MDADGLDRIDRLEQQVEALRDEVAALRTIVAPEPRPAPAATSVRVEPEPVATALRPSHPEESASLAGIWRQLERGESAAAIAGAFDVLTKATRSSDTATLGELAAFADAAVRHADDPHRADAQRLATAVRAHVEPPRLAPAPAPALARIPAPTAVHAPPPKPPEPVVSAPGLGERAEAWLRAELTGARAFAIAGGAVTLLGVLFLFVLAANRGWIGPAARVALGAAASALLVSAGVALRLRYGRVVAALAAVGTGLAGAYATLAAATLIYDYLPAWGAVLVAAAIASVGGAIAVAWSSEILAGLALVGAVVAPAAVALDEGIEWTGPAFALIVLAASIAVASPRRWLWLEATIATIAIAQVWWLGLAAPSGEIGSIAVGVVASLLLIAAAVAWQAYDGAALHGPAATLALAGGAVGLGMSMLLVADDRHLGLLLVALALALGVVAIAVGRRWRDLGWTIGVDALLLAGVGTAYLVSGGSLTTAWAIEAVCLAALAWKLGTPRFQATALAYLSAGAVNAIAVEIVPSWPEDVVDVPRTAAVGLFVLAAASLLVGLLALDERRDPRAEGLAAALEPVWDWLVARHVELRAVLTLISSVLLVAATAAVLDERWLTILWAIVAALLGVAAFLLGERRLQALALGFITYAVVHALLVEVPPETLALDRASALLEDPRAPLASLVVIACAMALLSGLTRFDDRGIARLGPLEGPETMLVALRDHAAQLRAVLAFSSAVAVVWAAGLVAIDADYGAGQVVATVLWSALGLTVVCLATRVRSVGWEVTGAVLVFLAFFKSVELDWDVLGDVAAAISLLFVAATALAAGFVVRWWNPGEEAPVELASLASAGVAAVAAVVAFERLWEIDSRSLGVATLIVVAAMAAAGAAPYRAWRTGRTESWLRHTANGYWAVALGALLVAEQALVLGDRAGTIALCAVTAAGLALAWKPLAEDRVWLAALGLVVVPAVATLAEVTAPSKLVEASAHPASGLWVLAVVIAAAWAVALTCTPAAASLAPWLLGTAAGLTLFGCSLGVLEVAERISGSSVTTDFQRGHTALSALWGIGALALYVVGLARDRGDLRIVGLALFGLSLAKLFLYDLSSLSSVTRAFSFIAVGGILLAAGFFAERFVSGGGGPPAAPLAGGGRS